MAAAQLRFADWVDKFRPELSTESIRASIARTSAGGPVVTRKYRYTSARAGKIRIEETDLPENDSKPSDQPAPVRLYDGTQWQSYSEARVPGTGSAASGLVIRQSEPAMAWFEIARGTGVLLSTGMSRGSHPFDLERRARDFGAVGWEELLRNLPESQTRIVKAPIPGTTAELPSLVFETAPLPEGTPGAYRLQVWFDPAQSFAVAALAETVPTPSGDGGWTHQPRFTATWSDPATIDGGLSFFRKCLLRHYELVLTPVTGKPEMEWPRQPFEALQVEYSFENVRLNEPVEAALFEVKPAPGTHVTDERKGFTYVLGKAGEELEKTAIAERERKPGGTMPSDRATWRTLFVAANLIALFVLIAYRVLSARRKRT